MAKDKLRPDIEDARARMRTKAGSGKEIERLVGFMWDDEHVERMTSGSYGVGTGLLVLRGENLTRAGLAGGDLVAASEASATTIAVRCARRCTVRQVAVGPAATHGEGHITFVTGRDGAHGARTGHSGARGATANRPA